MPKAKPAPRAADFQQAMADLPDGPNVAPSAHEHEAAQGRSPLQASASPGAQAAAQHAPSAQQDQPSREQRIQQDAYALAAQRGFAPGGELDDWLQAERRYDGDSRDGEGHDGDSHEGETRGGGLRDGKAHGGESRGGEAPASPTSASASAPRERP
jgi:hypothetical protein